MLPEGWANAPVNTQETFKIEDGPNDWDMWLSLRELWAGTKNNVGFLLDRPMIPRTEVKDRFGCEFMAKITSIRVTENPPIRWHIEGRIYYATDDTRTRITFKAIYDPFRRKGGISFNEE